MKLLVEAIVKYNDALDSISWEANFLKMWRVLELLTFYSECSTMKTTSNRIKLLFRQKPKWNYSIDAICDLRNILVHKGVYPEEGLEELSILKYIVENAIWTVFCLSGKLKTRSDLELFYAKEGCPSGQLKKEIKMSEFVLKSRGKL